MALVMEAGTASGRPSARPWPRLATVMVGALIFLYAVVLVRTAWVSDDAFISLRVIDNFVHGLGLRWNPSERVQAYTHPLWLFLVAAAYSLTREPYLTTIAVSALVSMSAALLLTLGARTLTGSMLAASGLILSNAYIDYSTAGLENPLTHLLLVLFALQLLRENWTSRALLGLAVTGGLATLNRMDAVLLVGPGLALALWRFRRWTGVSILLVGFSPFLAWEVFSVVYYGIPYPNTALAKLNTGIPTADLLRQGLRYLANSARWDPLTLSVIVLAMWFALHAGRATARSLVLGAWLYVAYVVSVGGDFMSGRFLSAPYVLALAAVSIGAMPRTRTASLGLIAGAWVMGLLASRPALSSGADCAFALGPGEVIGDDGIADERRFYFTTSGLLNGQDSWTRPWPGSAFRAIGEEARRERMPVLIATATGMTGYFAGPEVHIVDTMALADPLLSRLPMSVAGERWRVGHFYRAPPAGYLATLASGRNQLADPRLATLFDQVSLVTRAPIWDRERLGALLRPNRRDVGAVGNEYAEASWAELIEATPGPLRGGALALTAMDLSSAGSNEDALSTALAALAADPDCALALRVAAEAANTLGRVTEGEALSRRLLAMRPGWQQSRLLLAKILAVQGRATEALSEAMRAARGDRALAPDAWAMGAVLLQSTGRPSEALRLAEAAVDLAPRWPVTQVALGTVLLEQGQPGRAASSFERAMVLRPDEPEAVVGMARTLWALGRGADALDTLNRFLAEHPEQALALYERGTLLAASGEQDRANADWLAAARLGYEPARRALRGERR